MDAVLATSHNAGMKPERILILVVGGIVLLAGVAAVVAAVRPVSEFEPGTPEATVQDYLRAVLEGDEESAASFFASGSDCAAEDIDRDRSDAPARVALQTTDAENGAARVRVEIVFASDGGPFDTYEYSQEETFELVREGDGWLITDEPWPMFFCRGGQP